MGFLRETGMPVPYRFITTAETALNLQLQKMFTSDRVEIESIREVVNEIKGWNVAVDNVALEFIICRRLEGAMAALLEEPEGDHCLPEVLHLVESIAVLPVGVNLWQAQNMYWSMLQSCAADIRSGAEETNRNETIRKLGQLLFFNVEAVLEAAKGDI